MIREHILAAMPPLWRCYCFDARWFEPNFWEPLNIFIYVQRILLRNSVGVMPRIALYCAMKYDTSQKPHSKLILREIKINGIKADISDNLLLIPEHTWGMDIKTYFRFDKLYSNKEFKTLIGGKQYNTVKNPGKSREITH